MRTQLMLGPFATPQMNAAWFLIVSLLNSGPPSLGCHRSIDRNAMQHVSPAAIVSVAAPGGLEGCSDGFNEVRDCQ
jgi:hypothetical protein